MTIIFGQTPPPPKTHATCKAPRWRLYQGKYVCLTCYTGNPCVIEYGAGPEGATCESCAHLRGFRQSTTWYKCELRQWTANSGKNRGTVYPGKDHRLRWPACARFAPIETGEMA